MHHVMSRANNEELLSVSRLTADVSYCNWAKSWAISTGDAMRTA